MKSPPSPMDVETPRTGKKRSASNFSPPAEVPDHSPALVHRQHHRRYNVASTTWGPETLPPTAAALFSSPARRPGQPFNIYKALIRHPNLFFQLALRLPYSALCDLFAIDKEFHFRLNEFSVSLIHDYAKFHAPVAGYIFTWALYPALCISDPTLRPMDAREWLARDVPGFRWLGMALQRERVVRCILTRLGVEGHRVPEHAAAALMKFWSVGEMRTSVARAAFLADREIWTDRDFALVLLVVVKLDMRFAHPVMGNGAGMLSRLLLTQHSLTVLCKLLTGKKELHYEEATEMLVRTFDRDNFDNDAVPWLEDPADTGVPIMEEGLYCRENWDPYGAPMDPLIDTVVTEGLKRGLRFYEYYLDFVLYGHVDGTTGKNLPMPRKVRGDKSVVVPKKGWPEDRRRMKKKVNERFGKVFGDEKTAVE